MYFANVNGTTLHYSDTGSGLPIVLVHGIGASLDMWRPQIEQFSASYRVIAIDVRGVGKSGRLTGWTNIIERQTEDLARLLDYLGIESAVICGVSYGGVFVQRFALDHPHKCLALGIIDSYSTTRPTNIKELLWLIQVYLGAPSNLLPNRWLASLMKTMYRRWPETAEHMADLALELRGYETMKTRLAINHIDYLPELNAITVPTLCAVGGASWPLSVPYMQKTADAIPGCDRLHLIPDSYDPSNLCQTGEFNKLLHSFLAALPN